MFTASMKHKDTIAKFKSNLNLQISSHLTGSYPHRGEVPGRACCVSLAAEELLRLEGLLQPWEEILILCGISQGRRCLWTALGQAFPPQLHYSVCNTFIVSL